MHARDATAMALVAQPETGAVAQRTALVVTPVAQRPCFGGPATGLARLRSLGLLMVAVVVIAVASCR